MANFSIEDAISEKGSEVHVLVRVTPSSITDAVKGFDRWRGRFKIDISQPPVKGRANKQVISFFRIIFPNSTDVRVKSGETKRDKCVTIEGIALEEARGTFRALLSI